MQKTNALQLRQNLGSVLKILMETGEPVLVEKGKVSVAVLVSLEDYQKRFVDIEADQKRREVIQNIKKAKLKLPSNLTSVDLIRSLREA